MDELEKFLHEANEDQIKEMIDFFEKTENPNLQRLIHSLRLLLV